MTVTSNPFDKTTEKGGSEADEFLGEGRNVAVVG